MVNDIDKGVGNGLSDRELDLESIMKEPSQLASARATDAKAQSLKPDGQPAQRRTVVPKARATATHSDSTAPSDKLLVDTSTETSASTAQVLMEYQRDFFECSILFWDTLRKRANNMLEHERAGMPPLLDFKYETLLDARHFERPANYALLRITQVGDDCWEDCVDLDKPPVIVVDPRAGHGPGIGGFKQDSEVGTGSDAGGRTARVEALR